MSTARPSQGADSAPAGGSAAAKPQAWADQARRTRVIAHRGSSARHPDNSWAAFAAAVADGADAIECDVQASRDGAFVLHHDLWIGDCLVTDLRVAEIEAVNPRIVRLPDLLAWAPHAPVDLLIEVKDPDAAGPVARKIVASGWNERIVLGGFHGPALAAAKAAAPAIKTSFMMGSVVGVEELLRLAAAYRVDGIHLCWETRAARPHRLVDRAAIECLRREGLAVTLWHEEREAELRTLVAVEPDAICTNIPAMLRRIVDGQVPGQAGPARGPARANEAGPPAAPPQSVGHEGS